MSRALTALRNEIASRQRELAALKKALAEVSGTSMRQRRGKERKPKTAAQKKALSAALKAAWKRRKAAQRK